MGALSAERVEKIMAQALADGGAPLQGIVHEYALNRATVAEHRTEIEAMLGELPEEFMDDGGGGWSFLNLCQDRHGHQWTGLHLDCEQLLVLADALELASYPLAREIWDALPGGVPYVVIRRSRFRAGAPQ